MAAGDQKELTRGVAVATSGGNATLFVYSSVPPPSIFACSVSRRKHRCSAAVSPLLSSDPLLPSQASTTTSANFNVVSRQGLNLSNRIAPSKD
ncbi:unnamed protein product [Lactuca virosa]|uniref:Uncharacterized protein n=1 Tax=Lactuca virosa TaxID=75947 RepID=A0AAU9LNW7_9ASTR|nr:unnamed protein product [Lactuca virosa]